jgi:hypothetical protein
MEDQDAWTLARYMCSPVMQCETSRLYSGLELYQLNSPNVISVPNQNLPCGFPFEGSTTVQGIGTEQGTWGTSSLQLTKLTTVQSREPKRRDVLVLPASMETFVLAIELLAEKHAPCEVAFIGTGERDTTFGAHTLASFPTHEPHKRKKIGWAWIKRENRPRRVAIAEICSEDKIAYALEIERTNQEHAILVLARNDFQRIGAGELQAFLLLCALRRGWVPEDQMPGYRRKTTTHRELVAISVLESRIWRKIGELFGSPMQPE